MRITSLFRWGEPYPTNFTVASSLRHGIGSGLFVILFMTVAQPFGLSFLSESVRDLLFVGYGIITTLVIVFSGLALPRIFSGWCREESWTVGRFILFASGVTLVISFASFEFTYQVFRAHSLPLDHLVLWRVVAGTVLIGGFIITAITLTNLNRLLRQSSRIVAEANARLVSPVHQFVNNRDTLPEGEREGEHHGPSRVMNDSSRTSDMAACPPSNHPEAITLNVEEGKRICRYPLSELICFAADENYVKIHLLRDKEPTVLVRSTLASIEMQLADFRPTFFRCHRAFVVNTGQILNVAGNAQGLRLTLKGLEEPIPVSRRFVEEFRQRVLPLL